MTTKLWNIAVRAVQSQNDAPLWVREQALLTFEQMSALPTLETAPKGQDTIPTINEKIVMPDYLDFLRDQIKLEPRGPEWTKILKKRLLALEPFVNKSIITASFHRMPYAATLKINPESGEVIHIEVD